MIHRYLQLIRKSNNTFQAEKTNANALGVTAKEDAGQTSLEGRFPAANLRSFSVFMM